MHELLLALCLLIIIKKLSRYYQLRMLRNSVLDMNCEFVSSDEFFTRWENGLKYREASGCYALFFYDHPISLNSVSQRKRFRNLYIGQSENIFYRVHEHFSGRGNDGAMRLLSHGTPAYAVFLPCGLWRMNVYEKSLIRAFRSDIRGLNVRAGGARER